MNISILTEHPTAFAVAGIVLAILLLVGYLTKRTSKVLAIMDKIYAAKTFPQITELRHTLSPTKWSKDIDDAEKKIINGIIEGIEATTPAEIGIAFNYSLRFEVEYKNKFRKMIIAHLGDQLNQLRKAKEIKAETLKELKALAHVVYHTHSIEEIKVLEKIHQPTEKEVEVT